METASDERVVELVRMSAQHPGQGNDLPASLCQRIGAARFVLIGEATHGTHQFYDIRAKITRRLLADFGFNIVAVEADWPDAWRVNRYVQHAGDDANARAALDDFRRFPMWMWRNRVAVEFVEWLRHFNAELAPERRAGFYGLDLYSLYASARAVISYLEAVDPDAAEMARVRYRCLEHPPGEPERYGAEAGLGLRPDCERKVVRQLVELRRSAAEYLARDGRLAADEQFYAEQNARLVLNAERYYRQMFRRGVNTWNLRDEHMADTLDALVSHRATLGDPARAIVWAHNSHIGDARATEFARRGELNLGQLVRERHDGDCVLIGMTTYEGSVTAASQWDGPHERKRVRPALPGSVEALFHESCDDDASRFTLVFEDGELKQHLQRDRLSRAIGVIYRPETERHSHYFDARTADQFDAVIHIDRTTALEPLDISSEVEHATPETFPFGV